MSKSQNLNAEAWSSAETLLFKSKRRLLRAAPRRRVGTLILFALISCGKKQPEKHQAKPLAAQEEPTPVADKIIAEDDGDPAWLTGTWQERDQPHWFLFNLPGEVAELRGKPAKVIRRGKLDIHGRYVSAIFPNGEVHFTATKDRAEMQADAPRGTYRRGAPP